MLRPNTVEFLGDPTTWRDVRVSLDDMHGLWGGRRIMVTGTGEAVIELVQPIGRRSGRFEVWLNPEDVQQLLTRFIENDFLTLVIPSPEKIIPDSVHTSITLTNASGAEHTVGCWSGTESDVRFEKLVQALLEIEARIQEV